jgi:hypothetical protein
LCEEFLGGLGDPLALVSRPGQFIFRRLTGPVSARDGGCAIGSAARRLSRGHLPGKAVIEPDDRHAEVHQVGGGREQRHFLSAVLRAGGGESSADLAVQGALCPQAAGQVEEGRHL